VTFDPFGDFATEGYLRNFEKEKDLAIVKRGLSSATFRSDMTSKLSHEGTPIGATLSRHSRTTNVMPELASEQYRLRKRIF
jgi:hypothetical protein